MRVPYKYSCANVCVSTTQLHVALKQLPDKEKIKGRLINLLNGHLTAAQRLLYIKQLLCLGFLYWTNFLESNPKSSGGRLIWLDRSHSVEDLNIDVIKMTFYFRN